MTFVLFLAAFLAAGASGATGSPSGSAAGMQAGAAFEDPATFDNSSRDLARTDAPVPASLNPGKLSGNMGPGISPGPQTVRPGQVAPVVASQQEGPAGPTGSPTPAKPTNYAKAVGMAGIGWVALGFLAAVTGFGLPVVIGASLVGAGLGAAFGLGLFGGLFGKK